MRVGRMVTLVAMLVAARQAGAGGSLGIPTQIDGYPTNVGLLVMGHSTSAQGDYPAKLAAALNDPGNVADGRNYVAVRAITGGDGGFLWSRLSVPPTDVQYDRVQASAGPAAMGAQWCADAAGVRWSCRRAKVEAILTGANALPATGSCGQPALQNACAPGNSPQATMTCTWYDRTLPPGQNPVTQQLSFHDCWMRMDYHLALVQDTTNRSWPVDDFDGSGRIDDADRWPSSRIPPAAWPCGGTSGVVAGTIDWNCDGAVTQADAAQRNAIDWLRRLSLDLLDTPHYGAAAAEHVFVMPKPLEMGQCNLYPPSEQTACTTNRHAIRTPAQIAATPGRPLDHYYVPTVFWEHRLIEDFLIFTDRSGTDARIHAAAPGARAMWDRSARCYAQGLGEEDWTVPASVPGRPTLVAADDSEQDGGASPNSSAIGCMVSDHVHHNEAGGWMMADVWYRGLLPYLQ
jgi:hypothetical protein